MRLHTKNAVALLALGCMSATQAQDRVLEEIIVTAQKRAENSQTIPIAITAIGAEQIEKLSITTTEDLVRLAPSLTFSAGDNKNNSGFRIRGIGTNAFSIGVEQSVAVIIDDTATVLQGQSIADLADIERIEVLRGPQSTLFGKSASAGAINVVTKGTAEELEGSLEVLATDDDETSVKASISGPISDSLGFRVSAYKKDYDGNVDNLSIGSKVNGYDNTGFRAKLSWQVTENIDATLIAHTMESDSDCCALTWTELDPNALVFGFVPGEVAPGITPSDENYTFRSDSGPVEKTENDGGSLKINIGLGEHTLTSITAQNTFKYRNDGDVDFSDVDVFGFFTGGAITGGFFSNSFNENDFFSQELRLLSPSGERFEYVVGLYYADAETDRSFLRNPGLPILQSDWTGVAATETLALYGNFTWELTGATSLSAGLRWNDEEISFEFNNNLTGAIPPGSNSDTEVLGNVSLQHLLGEDLMVYARFAQGYKGQAYDLTTTFNQDKADNPVGPETSDTFAIGMKSTLLDGRMRLNAEAFFGSYEGFQAQSTSLLPNGSLVTSLNNVGDLETKGLEIDGQLLVGDNLTFSFSAAYVDAEIQEFLGADCFPGQTMAEGCFVNAAGSSVQDIRGGVLPNSPETKFNVGAEYVQPFDSLPFDGFVLFNYVWQDEVNFNLLQNPGTVHDSYGLANLSFGISEKSNQHYRITAFVNNLTDENYRSSVADLRQLYGGLTSFAQVHSRNSERHFGLRVKVAF